MLLSFFLLFFLCESTVKSQITAGFTSRAFTTRRTIPTEAPEEKLPPLQLVATPNYPVAVGQKVHLHCSAVNMTVSVKWVWQRQENQTWQEVGTGRDQTLTEPEESGIYRCRAQSRLSQKNVTSPEHTVYIVSKHTTVPENLGIAAFFLSLLALFINIAILFWLGCQRFGTKQNTSTAAKSFPGPEKSSKGGLPHPEIDGDVYMNYTNTSPAYTDLDPTIVAVDNVYSSLS
ncbi:uncharacterized protein LOC121953159 [Plectropomus leopardus]|uniref:uncharacterized protein LOC121953159 n=1 Tax=Plectropomus leopardus TaxID=160734 RepID=UPI001C4C26DA|nr:uncharacterized protein LOC121953159 [Plectropomus leopardus]